MNKPHYLTLGEAAKATGKSKTTIHNAVKKGKISGGNRGDGGQYQVDPAELFRVYPMKQEAEQVNSKDNTQIERSVTPKNNGDNAAIDALKLVIEQLETRIEEKDELVTDYKTRLAKSEYLIEDKRSDAEKARAALQAEQSKPQPTTRKRRLTLWERIKGGEVDELVNDVA